MTAATVQRSSGGRHLAASSFKSHFGLLDALLGPDAPPPEALLGDKFALASSREVLLAPDQLADAQAALGRVERRVQHLRQRQRLESTLHEAYDTLHDTFPASPHPSRPSRSATRPGPQWESSEGSQCPSLNEDTSDDTLSPPPNNTSRLANQLLEATEHASNLRFTVLQHYIATLAAQNTFLEQQRDAARRQYQDVQASASSKDAKDQTEPTSLSASVSASSQISAETHASVQAELEKTTQERDLARQELGTIRRDLLTSQEETQHANQRAEQAQFRADQADRESQEARTDAQQARFQLELVSRQAEQDQSEVKHLLSEKEAMGLSLASHDPSQQKVIESAQAEAAMLQMELQRVQAEKNDAQARCQALETSHQQLEEQLSTTNKERDTLQSWHKDQEALIRLFKDRLNGAEVGLREMEQLLSQTWEKLSIQRGKRVEDASLARIHEDSVAHNMEVKDGATIEGLTRQVSAHLNDLVHEIELAKGKFDQGDSSADMPPNMDAKAKSEAKQEDEQAKLPSRSESFDITDAPLTPPKQGPQIPALIRTGSLRDARPAPPPLKLGTGPNSDRPWRKTTTPQLYTEPVTVDDPPSTSIVQSNAPTPGSTPFTAADGPPLSWLREELSWILSALDGLGPPELPAPPASSSFDSTTSTNEVLEPLDTALALDQASDSEAWMSFCQLFPRATAHLSKASASQAFTLASSPTTGYSPSTVGPPVPKAKNARFAALAAQFETMSGNGSSPTTETPRLPRSPTSSSPVLPALTTSASSGGPISPLSPTPSGNAIGTTPIATAVRWASVSPHITALVQRTMHAEQVAKGMQEYWQAFASSLYANAPQRTTTLAKIRSSLIKVENFLDENHDAHALTPSTPGVSGTSLPSPSLNTKFFSPSSDMESPRPGGNPILFSTDSKLRPSSSSSYGGTAALPSPSPTASSRRFFLSSPRRRTRTASSGNKGPMNASPNRRQKQTRNDPATGMIEASPEKSLGTRASSTSALRPSATGRSGLKTVTLGMDPVALSLRVRDLEQELQGLQRQASRGPTGAMSKELSQATEEAEKARAEMEAMQQAMEGQVTGLLEELNEVQSQLAFCRTKLQSEEEMHIAWQEKYAQLLEAQADSNLLGAALNQPSRDPSTTAKPLIPPPSTSNSTPSTNVLLDTALVPLMPEQLSQGEHQDNGPSSDAALTPHIVPQSASQPVRWLVRAP